MLSVVTTSQQAITCLHFFLPLPLSLLLSTVPWTLLSVGTISPRRCCLFLGDCDCSGALLAPPKFQQTQRVDYKQVNLSFIFHLAIQVEHHLISVL